VLLSAVSLLSDDPVLPSAAELVLVVSMLAVDSALVSVEVVSPLDSALSVVPVSLVPLEVAEQSSRSSR